MTRHIATIAALMSMAASAQTADTQTVSLLFAGDMMQHAPQITAARQPDGTYAYDECFEAVGADVASADVAICNFEVTLGGPPYKGYPQFSAPDDYFEAMTRAGFDVFLTANNHCLDKGRAGLERTIRTIDSLGYVQLGTYLDSLDRCARYPAVVEKNGIRIALLNYTYGTNGLPDRKPAIVNRIDRRQMKADIERARQSSPDLIIANMHWGDEYKAEPNDGQRQLARWLIDQGVDHVIGSHPHTVQTMEMMADDRGGQHLVVYSLGNYLSNMTKDFTAGGLTVRLTFEKTPQGTRLTDCRHCITYVARPVDSQLKNYKILSAGSDISNLPTAVDEKMRLFVDEVRRRLAGCTCSQEYTLE